MTICRLAAAGTLEGGMAHGEDLANHPTQTPDFRDGGFRTGHGILGISSPVVSGSSDFPTQESDRGFVEHALRVGTLGGHRAISVGVGGDRPLSDLRVLQDPYLDHGQPRYELVPVEAGEVVRLTHTAENIPCKRLRGKPSGSSAGLSWS
jgi:hypothetical protein